jgi:hypothetical protein
MKQIQRYKVDTVDKVTRTVNYRGIDYGSSSIHGALYSTTLYQTKIQSNSEKKPFPAQFP